MKRVKVKGTVLYTVVSVMMIMIVFVMASLTIASIASKRSYNTYFKNQALYSARSVTESTIQALQNNSALKSSVGNLNASNSKVNITVKDSSGSDRLPDGMGTVNDVTVEYVGKDAIDDKFVAGTGKNIIKVSATVTLGGQESTFSRYVLAASISKDGPGAGLLSFGSIEGEGSTSMNIYGSTQQFNSPLPDSIKTDVSADWTLLKNSAGLTGGATFNSNVYLNTNTAAYLKAGQGVYVAGSLITENGPEFISLNPYSDYADYTKIPHIYVRNVFLKENPSWTLGASNSLPINMYVGTMGSNSKPITNFVSYGDIYAYDEFTGSSAKTLTYKGSTYTYEEGLSVFGDTAGTGVIKKWVTNLMGEPTSSSMGGNFYTNGALKVNGNGSTFEGDVIAKNKVMMEATGSVSVGDSLVTGSDLSFKNNTVMTVGNSVVVKGSLTTSDTSKMNITGALVVNGDMNLAGNVSITTNTLLTDGKLNITGNVIINAPGGIYCNSSKIQITSGNLVINGIQYDGAIYPAMADYIAAVNAAAGDYELKIENMNNASITIKSTTTAADVITSVFGVADSNYPSLMDKEALTSGDEPIVDDLAELKKNYVETRNKSDGTSYMEYKNYCDRPENIASDDDTTVPVCYGTIYEGGNIPSTISSNCTLTGTLTETITITAPDDGELWIALVNFNTQADSNIIVKNTGKVNFFVPKKGTVIEGKNGVNSAETITLTATGNVTFNKCKIITEYYNNVSGDVNVDINPEKTITEGGVEKTVSDTDRIPNIYLYVAGGKGSKYPSTDTANYNAGDTATVKFDDSCIFTGYLYAHYADFSFANPSGLSGASSVKYTDANDIVNDITKGNIAIIGQVIVGEVKQMQNDNIVLQVSSSGLGNIGQTTSGLWTTLDGYAFGG